MLSIVKSENRVLPITSLLGLLVGVCSLSCGCSWEPELDSVKSGESNSRVLENARHDDDIILDNTRRVDDETDLRNRDSVKSRQSIARAVENAQHDDDTILDNTREVNDETDLRDLAHDRIEVLTDVQDPLDRQAIQVAVDWLKNRSAEPLDIELKLGRRGDSRNVYVVFVGRDESGEPFYVPGGHCTITISKTGQVIDIMKGA